MLPTVYFCPSALVEVQTVGEGVSGNQGGISTAGVQEFRATECNPSVLERSHLCGSDIL